MVAIAGPLLRAAQQSAPAVLRAGSVALGVGGRGASEQQCTVALVKNIVGTGVLTLPAGIARLCDGGASAGEATTLAVVLMIGFGALAAWGFLLVGAACAHTRQSSFVGAWTATLGGGSSWLPALASLLLCSTAAISCATVLADTGTDLLSAFLSIPRDELSRNAVLAGTAGFFLTPLCLLPSLAPLGTASYFGVAGVGVAAVCMLARLVDGSYAAVSPSEAASTVDAATALLTSTFVLPSAPAGADLASVVTVTAATNAATLPSVALASPLSTLPSTGAAGFFVSLISNAFLAHYNAPGVLYALQPEDGVEAEAAPIQIETTPRAYRDRELDETSWQAAFTMRLQRAAEISAEFAE